MLSPNSIPAEIFPVTPRLSTGQWIKHLANSEDHIIYLGSAKEKRMVSFDISRDTKIFLRVENAKFHI